MVQLKAKKSVALSGVAAGNTALCSVGKSGNDLHYRGYEIDDLAHGCSFEEVAYLLIHGALPDRAQLAAYEAKLVSLRGLPDEVKSILEHLPANTHPMDVLRTGVSALGASAWRAIKIPSADIFCIFCTVRHPVISGLSPCTCL